MRGFTVPVPWAGRRNSDKVQDSCKVGALTI
jgi:hypothetical protein